MNKNILAAFFLLFAGCGTPAYIEQAAGTDLSGYRTYSWVETREKADDASERATSFADISIHNEVDRQLEQRGWRKVDNDPDAYLSYDILVERSVEERRDPVYTQPMTRYYYNRLQRRWTPVYFPSQFMGYETFHSPIKEATITVLIIDARTDKSIWQGWSAETLSESRLTDEEIRSVVQRIFRKDKNNSGLSKI